MEKASLLTAAEIARFLDENFPEMHDGGQSIFVESVTPAGVQLRFKAAARHLRPGGTVSGPAQFALADIAAYVAVLAKVGPVALAVTTSATINFLRRPPAGDLIASARVIKQGRRLVVVDCGIVSDAAPDLVAHAVATYSLP